ncbi:MAG: type II toxin-antitoxin system HicB family antitoxin [Coprothermobacterota bacterium]|nr:type II toxin-antitoxin system HicB family antitoxin [Coprothermobacterota bacterium]
MLVKIENYFDGDCWCARGIGEDIFTQGRTLDELHENVKEAVACHFGDTSEAITILTLSEVKLVDAKVSAS